MSPNPLNTLVIHDYFATADGGGRLSCILANALDADLGYGFARPDHPFVQGTTRNPRERDLCQYSPLPLWQQFKLARAFEYRCAWAHAYQRVVYSGFYTPLAVLQRQRSGNLLYCHTPPRFIYDQRAFYLQRLPPPLRPLLQAFIRYLQPRYEAAVASMDIIIANSNNVRRRLQHYLGCDATVIYPPCDTENFRWQGQGKYYLSTARLDPLKRVAQIVHAFRGLPSHQLIVTSGGSELMRLRKLAADAPNIHFTGWVSETELQKLIGHAIAIIYLPHDEDFGMSPLEAMAAGKPVLGVAEGGLLETINAPQTGVLLAADFDVEALRDAVQTLSSQRAAAMRGDCEAHAQAFSHTVFAARMREVLESL